MLRVYLAAPYQSKELISTRAEELRAFGIEVTSRWLEETEKPEVQLGEVSREQRRLYAEQDVEDIQRSDVFVLQPDVTGTIKRAGRTVELGIAIGLRLPIYVVGPGEENIFYHLPQIYHAADWNEVVQHLVNRMLDDEIPF